MSREVQDERVGDDGAVEQGHSGGLGDDLRESASAAAGGFLAASFVGIMGLPALGAAAAAGIGYFALKQVAEREAA